MFGHGHHYYLDAFKKLGLEIRSNKINSRKYSANFRYFREIDSHEKAYWLGFIYADGFISGAQGRKKFGLSLSEKDISQIEKLKKCMESDYPINKYTVRAGYKPGSRYARLIVENEDMYDDLISHGVVEHKTDILKPPNIKPEYNNSFILGYFDGDGSIFVSNSHCPFYQVNIVGTDDLLEFIHNDFVANSLVTKNIKIEKRRDNQTVSYIRYGGNKQVCRIMDYLYTDVDPLLPLERKRQLYLNCKQRIF